MSETPSSSRPLEGKTILYATTIGSSAWSYFKGHLRYMDQQGANVHLVSNPDSHLKACGIREGITTHGIAMERSISPINDLIAVIHWLRLLSSLKPDVVNVGTPKAALLGMITSWLLRTPTRVYTVRGLRYETSGGLLRTVLVAAERLCCLLATDVVAVGTGVAETMRDHSISRKPVVVIGEGSSNGIAAFEISEAADALDRTECRGRWGIKPSAFVIGFVGRITVDKGAQVLADALAELRSTTTADIQLLVVGKVEDEESSALLASLPIPSFSTGWIDETTPAYKAMDVLCLPTRREGFPNVVLEAGAVGIPVVTTDATGARESVIEGVTGLRVPVENSSKLSNALLRLISSPQECETMGAAGRERAAAEYYPSRIWAGLVTIYLNDDSSDIRRY